MNPKNQDTDNDGVLDSQDIAPLNTSTATADAGATAQANAQSTAAAAEQTAMAQAAAQEASNQTATAIAQATKNAANALATQQAATAAQQAANATATEQAMACFLGEWVPTNPDGGMAQLNIGRVNQSTYSYHGYGQCSPTFCDWGEIQFPFSSPKLSGTFQFGFKSTRVIVECIGNGQLSAEVFDDYTVSDGRTDRTSFYTLKRKLTIFTDPIFVVTLQPQVISP